MWLRRCFIGGPVTLSPPSRKVVERCADFFGFRLHFLNDSDEGSEFERSVRGRVGRNVTDRRCVSFKCFKRVIVNQAGISVQVQRAR